MLGTLPKLGPLARGLRQALSCSLHVLLELLQCPCHLLVPGFLLGYIVFDLGKTTTPLLHQPLVCQNPLEFLLCPFHRPQELEPSLDAGALLGGETPLLGERLDFLLDLLA